MVEALKIPAGKKFDDFFKRGTEVGTANLNRFVAFNVNGVMKRPCVPYYALGKCRRKKGRNSKLCPFHHADDLSSNIKAGMGSAIFTAYNNPIP